MKGAKSIIKNQARPANKKLKGTDQACERCDEPILFALRDRFHEFSLGLLTVLECLIIAEDRGHVPRLPEGWWVDLANRYHSLQGPLSRRNQNKSERGKP